MRFVLPDTPGTYNNNFQIYQSPGYVVILVEMIHSARIIPVNNKPHLGKNLRQWLGDPRGYWEGDTLVIETTNLREDSAYEGRANAETFKVVERFSRVDADTLNYEFTVEDPKTWVKQWSASMPWNRTEGEVFEYGCHEGNYDIVHLLTGRQKREQEAETIKQQSRQ